MWAVLPFKGFARAKQRLAGVLTAAERQRLSAAMVADVLTALRVVPGLQGTLVVSDDPAAARLACRYGARVITEDPGARGLNNAAASAAAALAAEGVGGIMMVHGDLPLLTPQALAEVLRTHRAGAAAAVTIVPDDKDRGTNCLLCSPPDVITFHYGDHSCARHWQVACARGVAARLFRHPLLALDVDTPTDLMATLERLDGAYRYTHTYQMLSDSGIAARIRAMETGAARDIESWEWCGVGGDRSA